MAQCCCDDAGLWIKAELGHPPGGSTKSLEHKGLLAAAAVESVPDCHTLACFGLTATFAPTECLTVHASFSTGEPLRGVLARTRTGSPVWYAFGRTRLSSVPGLVHEPSARDRGQRPQDTVSNSNYVSRLSDISAKKSCAPQQIDRRACPWCLATVPFLIPGF